MKTIFFGKSTMQMSHFWKIYHANKIFLENLPFHGIISIEIDTTENSHAYMDMPRDNGESGKNCPCLQRSWRSNG
jgi:hypothetical protein